MLASDRRAPGYAQRYTWSEMRAGNPPREASPAQSGAEHKAGQDCGKMCGVGGRVEATARLV